MRVLFQPPRNRFPIEGDPVKIFCTFLLLFFASTSSAARAETETPLRPLQTGDQLIIRGCEPKPGSSIAAMSCELKPKGSATYNYSSHSNGTAELRRSDGTVQSLFTNNGGTVTYYRGNTIDPERQFHRFPPDGPPAPGMQWTVPTIIIPAWEGIGPAGYRPCAAVPIEYTAQADTGPIVSILINGAATPIRTVLITYEAYVHSCLTSGPQSSFNRKIARILYAPQIGWIAGASYLSYTTTGVPYKQNGWILEGINFSATATEWVATQASR